MSRKYLITENEFESIRVEGRDLVATRDNGTPVNFGQVVPDISPEMQQMFDDTVEARDQAEVFAANTVELQDEAIAQAIGVTSTLTRAALGKVLRAETARPPGVPVENFLYEHEDFDTTGVTSMSVRIQRALSNVPLSFGPLQIVLPPGKIRLSTRLNLSTERHGVGLRGSGMNQTTLVLDADVKNALYGYGDSNASTPTWLEDVYVSDFTVDCSAQVGSDSSFKGFNIGHMFNSRFENLRVINSVASAFGIDFLVNTWFVNCEGVNAGRGMHSGTVLGSGSTFGIGVGAYEDESIFFIDCRSKGAARMGWNLEWLHVYGNHHKTKVHMTGCHSDGDAVGVGDLGTGGIIMSDTLIENFTNAGIVIGTGGQAPEGGRKGHIDRSVTIRHGVKGGNPAQDVYGGHAVVIRGEETAGGYTIEPRCENNEGSAVYFEPGFRLGEGGLKIAPWALHNNAGVTMYGGGRTEPAVSLEGGYYEGNGVGLDLRTSLLAPLIQGNRFVSRGDQATAIRFDPAMVVDHPTIQGNASFGADVFITGDGNITNPHISDNTDVPLPTSDPSVRYFRTLKSYPTGTNGVGVGWAAVMGGVFTQSHTWRRERDGVGPVTDGPEHGATMEYALMPDYGVRVSAIYEPPVSGNARRGVAVSVDPATGDAVMFESGPTSFQVARYVGGERTVMWNGATGSAPVTERHEIGLQRDAGTNQYRAFIDGIEVWSGLTGTVSETRNIGLFAVASAGGRFSNLTVRKPVA